MIHGTTTATQRVRSYPISATVWKGEKRNPESSRPGADLKQFLRIETDSPLMRRLLTERCGAVPLGDSLKVEQLRVYLASRDREKAFETSLKQWGRGRSLKRECNRLRQFRILETVKDSFGGDCRVQFDPQDRARELPEAERESYLAQFACPVAEMPLSVACPHGCTAGGTLYFHLVEGVESPAISDTFTFRLTTSSKEDIANLSAALERAEAELGSIQTFEFEMQSPPLHFHQRIPWILYRARDSQNKPTGKYDKAKRQFIRDGGSRSGEHWELRLEVDPAFTAWLKNLRRLEQALACGLQPNPRSLAAFLSGQSPQLSLAPAPPAQTEIIDAIATPVVDLAPQPWRDRIAQLQGQLREFRPLDESEEMPEPLTRAEAERLGKHLGAQLKALNRLETRP